MHYLLRAVVSFVVRSLLERLFNYERRCSFAPIRVFLQGCHKKIEELCSSTVSSVPCPICGKEAKKVFSAFQRDRAHREVELPPQVAAGELNPAAAVAERRLLSII
jgi:hypothetical protein